MYIICVSDFFANFIYKHTGISYIKMSFVYYEMTFKSLIFLKWRIKTGKAGKVQFKYSFLSTKDNKHYWLILLTLLTFVKQIRSTEGCSKLKRSVDMTSSGKNGLNIRPNSSNLPCLYSTFHLEYPLVLSRFCFTQGKDLTQSFYQWNSKRQISTETPFAKILVLKIWRSVELKSLWNAHLT